jgi:hypothetical protein
VVHDNIGASFNLGGFGYLAGGSSTNTIEKYNDLTNAYSSVAALPATRDECAGFAVNGYGYVGAGRSPYGGSADQLVYIYSDVANSWYQRANYPLAARSPVSFVVDGTGYFSGGFVAGNDVATTYALDPSANMWRLKTPATGGNAGRYLAAGASFSGGGMVISGIATSDGGSNGGASDVSTTLSYFAAADIWRDSAPISSARRAAESFTLAGEIVTTGGSSGGPTSTVQSYKSTAMISLGSLKKSTATPTSISVAVLLNALTPNVPVQLRTDGDVWKTFMSGATALKLNETLVTKFTERGLLYATGGDNGIATVLSSNEFYNEVQNTWTTRTALTTATSSPSGFRISGLAYMAGGKTGLPTPTVSSITSYNDVTNAFTAKSGTLSQARSAKGNGATLNGFGYVVGGNSNGTTAVATVDKYNGTTDASAAVTSLTLAKTDGAVFQLLGRLFAINGSTGNGSSANATTDAERYDDILNTWTTLAAAASKSDTAGFALGGFGYSAQGGSGVSSSTQKYDPTLNTFASSGATIYSSIASSGSRAGGFGYVLGGFNGSALTTVNQFNGDTGTYTAVTSMNAGRESSIGGEFNPSAYRNYEIRVGIPAFYAGLGSLIWTSTSGVTPTAVNAAGGAACAVQGFGYLFSTTSAGSTNTIKYNETTNTASLYIAMPLSRYNAGAFSLHEFGYVFHGVGAGSTSAERLNIYSNSWTTLTNPGIAAGNDTSQGASLNGLGYILGGSIGVATSSWNDSTSAWTTRANNPSTSLYSRFALNGFIYSVAGASTYRYSDANNTWSASIATASGGDRSSLTYRGSVYTISLASPEKFNDSAGIWSRIPVPPSNTDGAGHFTLSTGIVLGRTADCQRLTDSLKQAVLSAGLTVS